jgi:hypothetical protein
MGLDPRVERPFRYVREDFFFGGRFRDLEDRNAQLRQWLDTVANVRVHGTTRRVVADHFAEEHPSLQGLRPSSKSRARRTIASRCQKATEDAACAEILVGTRAGNY